MSSIFVSYRRSASKHLARLLFERLHSRGYDVFLDITTIDSGEFDRIILNQIAARPHFLLVLSKGALERCANEDDWLRREIEEAFRLKRNIIPVYDEGFDIGQEKQYLPEPIRTQLSRLNALLYSNYYFDAFIDILCNRFLKVPEYEVLVTPTPPAERTEVARRIGAAASSGKNNQRKMMGMTIYEEFKDGTLTMNVMGRGGGFYGKFMIDDFKSDAWRTQSYETSSVVDKPNRNWFYIKDFVAKIDALATIRTSEQNAGIDNSEDRGERREAISEKFKDQINAISRLRQVQGDTSKIEIWNIRQAILDEMMQLNLLREAQLVGINLAGANLIDADMQKTNLQAVKLENADVRGANLEGACLRGSYLQGASLRGVNLQNADLGLCSLQKADFWLANLQNAQLPGAELNGTFFADAILEGANFQFTQGLTERQLSFAGSLRGARMANGSRYDGRFNLRIDLEKMRSERVDPTNHQAASNWYGVSREVYADGQQWAQENLEKLRNSEGND